MRRKRTDDDVFATTELSVPYFLAGQVARILKMEEEQWRLQKFLNSKRYRLTPEGGQLGKGQGSRRLFKPEDIFRLAIANRLVKDGFSPKFVSEVLQEIEDQELLEMDESGDVKPADIGFWRTDKGWRTEFVSRRASVEGKEGPYYVLRLSDLLPEIQTSIVQESKRR